MRIGQTKIAILSIFNYLKTRNKKTYCWPTRAKMLILLWKIHGISITLSTLDNHLGDLRDLKLIKSFKRTGRRSDGTLYNLPSHRQFTRKCIFFLKTLGMKIANWLIDWCKTGICPPWAKGRTYKQKPSSKYITKGRRDKTAHIDPIQT